MKRPNWIFDERPRQWGLRGDAHLWNRMSSSYALPAGAHLAQVHAHLAGLFAGLTGASLEHDGQVHMPGSETGGTSSGYIDPSFWREHAIPVLLRRSSAGQPLSVLCWNVNNRVGRVAFTHEAAAAAMATGADVLVFTEFFPQAGLERFTAELHARGWVYHQLSQATAVKANQVLVASRHALSARELPPTSVDDHLLANTLLVRVAGHLELLCSRVPTYTGAQRMKAWDWLATLADGVRAQSPSLLIGDLNTSLSSRAPVPHFAEIVRTWRRLQPLGVGSFFGKDESVTEIDHAMVVGQVDATAWYVRKAGDHVLAGGPGALSDHAGLFVQLSLPHL